MKTTKVIFIGYNLGDGYRFTRTKEYLVINDITGKYYLQDDNGRLTSVNIDRFMDSKVYNRCKKLKELGIL